MQSRITCGKRKTQGAGCGQRSAQAVSTILWLDDDLLCYILRLAVLVWRDRDTLRLTYPTLRLTCRRFDQLAALTEHRLAESPDDPVLYTAFRGAILDSRHWPLHVRRLDLRPVPCTHIIDSACFYGWRLVSLTLPDGIVSIGNRAFYNSRLLSVSLPASLQNIGDAAFYESQLTSLELPSCLESIGAHAFFKSKLTVLKMPDSIRSIGNCAFRASPLTQLALPICLRTIGDRAFYNAQLKTLALPNELRRIGEFAFYKSRITQLDWKSLSLSIGDCAFFHTDLDALMPLHLELKADFWRSRPAAT